MSPAIALDMIQFAKANQNLVDFPNSEAAYEQAAIAAQHAMREHSEYFAKYLVKRLGGTLASDPNNPTFNFNFSDEDHATRDIESLVNHADEGRSQSAALQTLNIMQFDLGYPSAFKTEDDTIVAMFMVATLASQFSSKRLKAVLDFAIQEEVQRRRQASQTPSWLPKLALVAVGFLIAWMVLK